jgi:perosamine synthetase
MLSGNDDMIARIGPNELKYVREVLEGQFRSSKGASFMGRLEKSFAEIYDSKFAVSMINGTATLHASLEAMNIGIGDEVIVPPLTMSATTFAVLQTGATPIFADVDERTYQISARSIEERVTDKTKAIVTVALYGLSPDMDPIMEIANRKGLFVLEDNAECFLGTYKGRLAGTNGNAASFSFQSSKHLTSGEGGIVITNDENFALGLRRISSLGYAGVGPSSGKITKKDIQNPNYSRHVSMGWNYRMPELCCAVALAQVERIHELVDRRKAVAKLFSEVTLGFEWFKPQFVPAGYENSYWTYVGSLDVAGPSWLTFRDTFMSNGGDGIYAAWQLTYLEPMLQNMRLLGRERQITKQRKAEYVPGLCPVAESLQPRLLQFKTNYWKWAEAEQQALILEKTMKLMSRNN